LFGRQFDLAQFSWQLGDEPSCQLYLGEAIPGDDLDTFPYGWGGWNLTGWQNAEFDLACATALSGTDATDNHQAAQEVFAAELPVIPLFVHQDVAAARPDICGFDFDETAGSLWNVGAFGYAELCE
jgi:ABC-type transport system substrate-binding protein